MSRMTYDQGYLLDRIEVQNFGGYHGPVSLMRTELSAMIFAGHTGAGKTTALDALRLLFNQRPSFNSASSQNGSKDRDLQDYYLGQVRHGSASDPDSDPSGSRLRGFGVTAEPTGILAVFRNGDGRVFTAARLLHMPKGQDYRWRNLIIPGDVSLSGPLASWVPAARFREAIEQMGGASYDTFDAYISALGDRFGLYGDRRDRAFRILDDAVSQRGAESVDLFARKYILPDSPFAAVLESAEGRISVATRSMELIERSRVRLDLLASVSRGIGRYRSVRASLREAEAGRDALTLLRAHLERRSALLMIRTRQAGMNRIREGLEALDAEIGAVEEETRRVDLEIAKLGGDRTEELRRELQRQSAELTDRAGREGRIREAASRAGIDLPDTDPDAWDRSLSVAEAERGRLMTLSETLEPERDRAISDLVGPERTLSELRLDLRALESRGSLMPRPLLEARAALASEMGLQEDQTPFLGELIQIRDTERDWEGVANRVLDGVARNILIPSDRYEEAKGVLARQHWGTRVVLVRAQPGERAPAISPGSLASKLDVLPDTPFREQALRVLSERVDHLCVEETAFRTVSGRAVTRSGAVQSGSRAEKDDRRAVNDPSAWVLGWSVEPRIAIVRGRIAETAAEVSAIRERAENARREIALNRDRVRNLDLFMSLFRPFRDIDQAPPRKRCRDLEAELERLSSGDLRTLQERRLDLARSQKDLSSQRSELEQRIGSLKAVVRMKGRDLEDASARARAMARPKGAMREALAPLLNRIADLCGVPEGPLRARTDALSALEDQGGRVPWDQVSAREEEGRDRLLKSLARARDTLMGAVLQARRDSPEETGLSDLLFEGDARSEEAMEDWIRAEQELRRNGIPELEGEYRRLLDEISGDTIAQIRRAIRTYDQEARHVIRTLNTILEGAVYDPLRGSRIQFRIRRVPDPLIRSFEEDLQRSVAQVLQPEADLEAVRSVIDRVRDRDDPSGRAERARLIDLSNWYQVDLEELALLEDGTLGDRINLHEGPTGQSGGQKQRLASVLFGVGLAHMFGIHEDGMSENALRIMILDEAFANLDQEGSTAAATLLRELGLQIILASPIKAVHAVSNVVTRMQLVSSDRDITRVEPVLMRAYLDRISHTQEDRMREAIARMEAV
jgi:uncharacterized protein YPO0396